MKTSRSLGQAIPEEIFPNILSWIGYRYYALRDPRQRYGISQEEVKPTSLRNCALVSRYWAKQCRRYMFLGMVMRISSIEHARWFREYTLHGSPYILKICDLIKELRIRQSYNAPRSFLDLVFLPNTRHKLREVEISGPVPANFPIFNLDTPHWNLPNMACPSPGITAYVEVSLHTINFPSFLHLVRYMKHFRAARVIGLYDLKWSDKVPFILPRPLPVFSRRQRIRVTATGCTDNFLVGLYVLAMYADSLIHAVVERDQQWATNAMLFVRDYYEGLDDAEHPSHYVFHSDQSDRMPTLGVEISRSAETFTSTKINFLCESKLRSAHGMTGRGSPRPMRIVGILLSIATRRDTSRWLRSRPGAKPTMHHIPDLALLRTDLEQRCALRSVIITFDSYTVLNIAVRRYPLLRKPWPHACDYRLACKRDKRHNFLSDVRRPTNSGESDIYVEIDPTTLEPTGEWWGNSLDFISSLLAGVR